jgi:hypothetical protein
MNVVRMFGAIALLSISLVSQALAGISSAVVEE